MSADVLWWTPRATPNFSTPYPSFQFLKTSLILEKEIASLSVFVLSFKIVCECVCVDILSQPCYQSLSLTKFVLVLANSLSAKRFASLNSQALVFLSVNCLPSYLFKYLSSSSVYFPRTHQSYNIYLT